MRPLLKKPGGTFLQIQRDILTRKTCPCQSEDKRLRRWRRLLNKKTSSRNLKWTKSKKSLGKVRGKNSSNQSRKDLKRVQARELPKRKKGGGGEADYAIDEFDRTNPFGAEFMPEVETTLPTPPPLPDDYELDDFALLPPPINDDGDGHGERVHWLADC